MDSSAHLHIIILAAGASTRLGKPKQLVPVAGRPALQHVIDRTTAIAGNAVSVVLGSHASDITPMLQHSSASVIINRDWQEGIASSIRCGIRSLSHACDAVMLVLGDQVAVTTGDYRRLISAWNGQDSILVASGYSGQFGVPAVFPRFVFSELMQLRGDQGAKLILHRHSSRLLQVPVPNATYDLDTPEDVTAVQEVLTRRGNEDISQN